MNPSQIRTSVIIVVLSVLCAGWAIGARAEGTWSAPLNLSESPSDTSGAALAVDSQGRVHAVWNEDGVLYHRVKIGGDWSAPTLVASGASGDLVTSTNGDVYLVFVNAFVGQDDVYFVHWAHGFWSLPVNVSETAGGSASPRLASSPLGGLAVVWVESAASAALIYIARSADGANWSAGPLPQAHGSAPVVSFDDAGQPQVAWQDVFDLGMPTEVFYARWTGARWTLPLDLSASPTEQSSLPALQAWGGDTYLAWEEAGSPQEDIYVVRGRGGTWEAPQKRSGSFAAHAPQLAFDALGHGHLAWSGATSIHHRAWQAESDIWEEIEEVARDQTGAASTRLAALQDTHVAWLADAGPGNREMYYSERTISEPTATPTKRPSATPTSSPTVTPTSSPTATPTKTVTTRPTDTPWPTATSTPTGEPGGPQSFYLVLIMR